MRTLFAKNRKAIFAGAFALALVAALSTGGALAYFTTYAQAAGGQTLVLGTTTDLTEEFPQGGKDVTITNKGDAPCFVRVKASTVESHPITISGTDWYQGDNLGNPSVSGEWWYYSKVLAPKADTSVLQIRIDTSEGTPTDDFDVIVLHEATVVSNAAGTAGDWSSI